MRRAGMVLLIFCLLPVWALAEDTTVRPGDLTPYISEGDYGFPVDELLLLLGCAASQDDAGEPVFDASSRAVLEAYQEDHGLEITGYFDAETLCLLLECPPNAREVWIPMHGGEKYHEIPGCSGMIYPCLMPVSCAEACGFAACEVCVR